MHKAMIPTRGTILGNFLNKHVMPSRLSLHSSISAFEQHEESRTLQKQSTEGGRKHVITFTFGKMLQQNSIRRLNKLCSRALNNQKTFFLKKLPDSETTG